MSVKLSGLLRFCRICTGNSAESCLRLAREDSAYVPQPSCMFPLHLSPIERRHQLTRTEIAASSLLSLHTVEWKLLMLCSDAIWSHFFSSPHKNPPRAIFPCNLPTPLSSGVAHPLLPPLFHSISPSYNQHLHHFNPFDPHPVCFPVSTAPGDYILPAFSPLRASLTVAGAGCCMLGS